MESRDRDEGVQSPEEQEPGRESDQLPEEQPAPAVPDDSREDDARDDAEETPGVPGEEGQATGHPDNAG